MSRGRHHTYAAKLRIDTTSCSGVYGGCQRPEQRGGGRGDVERKCGTEGCKEKAWKRERGKKKCEWVSRREGSKREDERVGGRWQEGSMQIAQDLTGIFLDG